MGSTLILVGLLGVINCGDLDADSTPATNSTLTSTKKMGDPSHNPTQMMYNVISMSWVSERISIFYCVYYISFLIYKGNDGFFNNDDIYIMFINDNKIQLNNILQILYFPNVKMKTISNLITFRRFQIKQRNLNEL